MHPLLANTKKLGLYLIVWLIPGLLITVLSVLSDNVSWFFALAFSVPVTIFLAFIGLSAYYLCRAFPLQEDKTFQLLLIFLLASVLSSALWVMLGKGWNVILNQLISAGSMAELTDRFSAILFGIGVVLYAASASVHYLMIEFEKSMRSERREFSLKLLAQEAELKTLRTQIDPHFLFNSLNSISALTTADPAGARKMTILLAEFLRKSLALGSKSKITLNEEIELGSNFLAIEKIRFGERLQASFDIDPAGKDCLVPPLILQPLIENAIKHGIGHLVEGGTIVIQSKRLGSRIRISVENPVDLDADSKKGANVGLDNTRKRLQTLYADEARVDIIRSDERFKVELFIPSEDSGK